MDLLSYVFSIAMYIFLALGLYTLAQRRGIANAWLAWLPIGNVWLIGAIADDFKLKAQGKKRSLRYWVTALLALTLVLAILLLVITFALVLAPMLEVLTYEDLMTLSQMAQGDAVSNMYAPAEEALLEDMMARMEAAMTEETMMQMTASAVWMTLLSLVLLLASIPAVVLEYICIYNVFESCEPQNKVLYLALSLLLGVHGVLIFLCRNKDLGMVPPAPQLPTGENYWQQN